ncbi:hypothetical protein SAMN04488548_10932 [Gordonia westfalica]|uniref:Uncharacterized protein n=1 Tax=Gordonia westfalica TaxID=158898 RepID=A0A1H2DNK1_9ACTN|nr:hypothetical protein SAMN04488548_10932 [Gordonia westfalica]
MFGLHPGLQVHPPLVRGRSTGRPWLGGGCASIVVYSGRWRCNLSLAELLRSSVSGRGVHSTLATPHSTPMVGFSRCATAGFAPSGSRGGSIRSRGSSQSMTASRGLQRQVTTHPDGVLASVIRCIQRDKESVPGCYRGTGASVDDLRQVLFADAGATREIALRDSGLGKSGPQCDGEVVGERSCTPLRNVAHDSPPTMRASGFHIS